jgi:HEAT repeat protein
MSALTGLTEEQLRALIIHELAHIRRCDYLVNLIQVAVETLLFYHPAVWWVSRQVRIEREHCCDDLAVLACGDALTYARALTEMERLRKATPQLVVAANGGMLMNRIRRIVGVQTLRANRFAGSPAVMLAMLTLVIGAVAQISSVANPTVNGNVETPYSNPLAKEEGAAVAALTTRPAAGKDRLPELRPGPPPPSNADVASGEPATGPVPAGQSRQQDFPADVVERLRSLQSSDPAARAAAACFLGRTREVKAIPFLIDLLGDEAAIEGRACWDNSTWNHALPSLKRPSPGEQAAIALASMGEPAVRPLIEALDHQNPTVRGNAAWAIGEVAGGHGIDRSNAVLPLIKALHDENLWVRKAAAFSLGEIRDRRAIKGLIAALEDGIDVVRDMAAQALGEMKARQAVEALTGILLKDEQWGVRNRAAWALGEIKDPLAVEGLQLALNDVDQRVRSSVKTALSEILD